MADIHNYEPLWGTWRTIESIGSGSFGTVYKAQQETLGHVYECAVKHISLPKDTAELKNIEDDLITSDLGDLKAYLENEIKNQAKEFAIQTMFIGHPNVVQIYDVRCLPQKDMAGYELFVRMERLNKIRTRIDYRRPDEKEVMRLAMDICTALSALHEKSVVHRDVKPQNILVSDDGIYKLADFGSTRFLSGTETYMSMKGGMDYTAPEIRLRKPTDFRSDIYSLGMVLYTIMNHGQMPFMELDGSITKEDADGKVLRGENIPAPSVASKEFAKIILKASAYESDDRYETAAEMKAAIEHLYNGDTEQTNSTRKHKLLIPIVAALVAIGLGIGGWILGTWQPKPETDELAARVETMTAEMTKQEEQIGSLTADNVEKEEQIKSLTEQAAGKDSQIDALNKTLAENEIQIEALVADVEGKTSEIATLTITANDKSVTIDTLMADAAEKSAMIETLTADAAEKGATIETLMAETADKTAKIEALTADADGKAGEIETLNSKVAEQSKAIETLTGDGKEKDQQISTLTAEMTEKSEQIATLNSEISAKEAEIVTLTVEKASMATQIVELTATMTKNTDAMNSSIAEKDQQIERMVSEAAEKDAQIATLSADIVAKSAEIETLTAKISAKDAQMADPMAAAENRVQAGTQGVDDTKRAELDAKFAVGKYVHFGTYPQTKSGDDKTPIEWIVLDRQENRALLFSRYALDCQLYHNNTGEKVTWETCSLRKWMSMTFYNKAFSEEERKGIVLTTVDNGASQGNSEKKLTGTGAETQDYVFLLSAWEHSHYLDASMQKCIPTAYALKQGGYLCDLTDSTYTLDGHRCGQWWLRTSGESYVSAGLIMPDGTVAKTYITHEGGEVRPAIWVDLSSGVF